MGGNSLSLWVYRYDYRRLRDFEASIAAHEAGLLLRHIEKLTDTRPTDSAITRFYASTTNRLASRLYCGRSWLHHRNYLMIEPDRHVESCRAILNDIVTLLRECLPDVGTQFGSPDRELAMQLHRAISNHRSNVSNIAGTYNCLYPPQQPPGETEEVCRAKLRLLVQELLQAEQHEGDLEARHICPGARYGQPGQA